MNMYDVSQPLGVFNYSKKTYTGLFYHLRFDFERPFKSELSDFLFDGLRVWICGFVVDNDFRIKSWHITIRPGKNINIFFEKLEELWVF